MMVSTNLANVYPPLSVNIQVVKLGGLEDNITDVLGLSQPLCSISQVTLPTYLLEKESRKDFVKARVTSLRR